MVPADSHFGYVAPMNNTAIIDWRSCNLVERSPGTVGGAWVFRGTRVPVWAILNGLKDNPPATVADDYPAIGERDIGALLDFIAQQTMSKDDGHTAR
jgi:uncharacterized protein (DUF433 family)